MTIRSAWRSLRCLTPLLAALLTPACKSPPPYEPTYAGEARTPGVTRRTAVRVELPPRNADGAIIEPEDCKGSFGDSIAIQGSLVVVGAPKAGVAGKAWVYDAERLDRPPVCLLPPPGVSGERFGASVSISPGLDRIVIGAPFAEVDGIAEMGRVYCWRRAGDTWAFERAFTDTDAAKGPERLGRSVIIDGEYIYAGAPHASMELRDEVQVPDPSARSDDPLDDAGAGTPVRTTTRLRGRFDREGAVLIWRLGSNGVWAGPRYALLPRGRSGARFGSSLARLSQSGEEVLAVGAPPQRTKQGFEGGTVSLFLRRKEAPWRSNAQYLLAPDGAEPADFFGGSLALGPPGLLIVGMAQANIEVAVDAGEVAIFQRNPVTRDWKESDRSLRSPMPAVGNAFGTSVAVVGRLVLVGEPRSERDDGTGRAFVFAKIELESKDSSDPPEDRKFEWRAIAELVAPSFLKARGHGTSLAASDDWVAVGASGEESAGCVTLFRIDRAASEVTTPLPAAPTNAAPSPAEAPAPVDAETRTPAATAEPAPTPPTRPASPPAPTSSRSAGLDPTTPGSLQQGATRPPPLPTQAEPASLFETPPETGPARTDGAKPSVAPPPTTSRPGEPYETPPETPGTKP
jgi:hypothetical protein